MLWATGDEYFKSEFLLGALFRFRRIKHTFECQSLIRDERCMVPWPDRLIGDVRTFIDALENVAIDPSDPISRERAF
jgi:hypothetical protein